MDFQLLLHNSTHRFSLVISLRVTVVAKMCRAMWKVSSLVMLQCSAIFFSARLVFWLLVTDIRGRDGSAAVRSGWCFRMSAKGMGSNGMLLATPDFWRLVRIQ
jgi:hypothetical protein